MNNIKLVAAALVVCAAPTGTPGLAAGTPAPVPTHAYVYFDSTAIYGKNSPSVLLDQGGAVGLLGCALEGGQSFPSSPAELAALVVSASCSDVMNPPYGSRQGVWQIFHQPKSDRIVLNLAESSFGYNTRGEAGAWTESSVMIFDRKSADQFSGVYTFIMTLDGHTPTVTTKNLTEIRAYDAAIQYPALPANVIEQ